MNNLFKRIPIVVFLLLIGFSPFVAAERTTRFAERKDVEKFINDVYIKHGISAWELKKLFKTVTPNPKVLQAISKPFEEVTWEKYKENFVTEERIKAGVEFWKQNEKMLRKAEADFGVPAEIIVSIIGVETRYGKTMGSFPVFQALATLAFDYPKRGTFFKGELEQFILLMHEDGLDPKTTLGSYAGAMGIPQFMPSSYRNYAISYDSSGRRDLSIPANAIGSVANYMSGHGWQKGEPIVLDTVAYGAEYQRLANTNALPKLPLKEYAQFNILPKNKEILNTKGKLQAAFILLNKDSKNPEPWLTLTNFYVITRYNNSINYAMAVYQLSERIKSMYYRQKK